MVLREFKKNNLARVKGNGLGHLDATIEAFIQFLDLRDVETRQHTLRVVDLTLQMGDHFGIRGARLENMRRGALLHDIGKIAIPDKILMKTGPLSPEEWLVMRCHPIYVYQILFPIRELRGALEIPYCHHEWWNGQGYPNGLRGTQIPFAARIFSVIDVWDALLSDRPYRRRWRREEALAYIREQAGKQFDPLVVEAFIEINRRNELARGEFHRSRDGESSEIEFPRADKAGHETRQ